MQVYRAQHRQEEPGRLLAAIHDDLTHLAPRHAGAHDRVVRLLIALGELEAGVADSLHAEADAPHPVTAALRHASVAAGHLLWHSWHGQHEALSAWAARVHGALVTLEAATLPRTVVTGVPEGYAYYGLFPETYLRAAVRCARALRMEHGVCVGIRSIGTSLSAVVSAALEELGVQVLSLTVRPRGHPFDRRLRLTPALEALLRDHAAEPFLVVDEGPGLSGSSFAGTARALSELGVSDDRIVLLPSWRTDGQSLRSGDARARWHRHRQFSSTFEEVWVETGRLADLAPGSSLSDLSAGKWRSLLLHDEARYPPVQRQHERRKLLARPRSGSRPGQPARLLRFAGLGAQGDARLRRGRALAEAGFSPPVLELRHGFLIQEFPAGTPGRAGQACPEELAATMARYLAHLRRRHPAAVDAPSDLRELLAINVTEALGEPAAERLVARFPPADAPPQEAPTALDGRMLPHEWVRTDHGFFKADALDHHDDHFYPGPQDIAWDVAGTCLEFGLDGDARRGFLARYVRESGDTAIAQRLPYHALAYLAFRLGYAGLAAESLGDDPDGARFRAETVRYRALLAAELVPDAPARWRA
jgi:hypothetical protein